MKTMSPEERQELIYRPFFIVWVSNSYPWGGVAVTDHFYDNDALEKGRPAERPYKSDAGMSMRYGLMTRASQAGVGGQ